MARYQARTGFLDGLNVSREDAEAMIMQARLKAGWVTEAELAPPARGGGSAGRRSRAASIRRSNRNVGNRRRS